MTRKQYYQYALPWRFVIFVAVAIFGFIVIALLQPAFQGLLGRVFTFHLSLFTLVCVICVLLRNMDLLKRNRGSIVYQKGVFYMVILPLSVTTLWIIIITLLKNAGIYSIQRWLFILFIAVVAAFSMLGSVTISTKTGLIDKLE